MKPSGIDIKTGKTYQKGDPRRLHLGNFTAWDAAKREIMWSKSEPFSVWSGALATAGDIVFYGTLEGYLKAVDAKTGEDFSVLKHPPVLLETLIDGGIRVNNMLVFYRMLAVGRVLVLLLI